MHRSGLAVGSRGIVLLAMLVLAVVVGVGAKGLDALTESSDATTTTPDAASIDAPQLPTTNAGSSQQLAPTVASSDTNTVPTATFAPGQPVITPTTASDDNGAPVRQVDQSGLQADVTARAVYAYDFSGKSELYELNSTERMPVGSIVKVATALVTVKYVSLDEVVTIDASDLVDPAVYSNMGLIEGDNLTVEQLLEGLLIPSGGDAAQALARYVGSQLSGSDDPKTARAAFVDAMNAYVEDLGLTDTHFTNATGDEADDNYSSARDVAQMGAQLMHDEDLAAIVAMPSLSFVSEGGYEYSKANTNELLGVDGIVGIKTGSTGEAGGCVVLAQEQADGGLVVLTILGSDLAYDDLNRIISDSRWDDAQRVLQSIESGAS